MFYKFFLRVRCCVGFWRYKDVGFILKGREVFVSYNCLVRVVLLQLCIRVGKIQRRERDYLVGGVLGYLGFRDKNYSRTGIWEFSYNFINDFL